MLDLLDYRRQVFESYRKVRTASQPLAAWRLWRANRDRLFAHHPQSALEPNQKAAFSSLTYYPYQPDYRIIAPLDFDVESKTFDYELGADGKFTMERFASIPVELPSGSGTFSLFWITGYGGGLFLPFKDATSGSETYSGGRYLYDTLKGADLGTTRTEIILDFNYAYHPSCYYNPRWVCPLAPSENALSFPVRAGERLENE